LVYITPCAGENKYEVEQDVAQYFPNHIKPIAREKYLLNLRTAIIEQLESVGIDIKNNLEFSPACTIENKNYHSFRRDKENAGRMTAFILMK
jgi:copper oxidase (laccase) domain-containing protein